MKYFITLILFVTYSLSTQADELQTLNVNASSGAKTWATHADGVSLSLTQILPDQAKAFYSSRGFSLEQIKTYASSCVFMTVLRNDSAPGDIHFLSNDWGVLVDNKPRKLTPVSQWVDELAAVGVKKSALIAFRWAQFPPEQEYKPGGDWNQGMFSVGLAPSSVFDLTAKWDIAGKKYEAILTGVECAK